MWRYVLVGQASILPLLLHTDKVRTPSPWTKSSLSSAPLPSLSLFLPDCRLCASTPAFLSVLKTGSLPTFFLAPLIYLYSFLHPTKSRWRSLFCLPPGFVYYILQQTRALSLHISFGGLFNICVQSNGFSIRLPISWLHESCPGLCFAIKVIQQMTDCWSHSSSVQLASTHKKFVPDLNWILNLRDALLVGKWGKCSDSASALCLSLLNPLTFLPSPCWCLGASVMSDCAALWTAACQSPLCMGFPRQKYGSGLPYPPPADHPTQG